MKLLSITVLLLSAPALDLDWSVTADEVSRRCETALAGAGAARDDVLEDIAASEAMGRLIELEEQVAALHDVLVVERFLASVGEDDAVRSASGRCAARVATFDNETTNSSSVFRLAQAALAGADEYNERQLARHYVEIGRRAGAHLEKEARAEMAALLQRLDELGRDYRQALAADARGIEINVQEAESLSPVFRETLVRSETGYIVPVDFSVSMQQFMSRMASGNARRRYQQAFLMRGGEANRARLLEALRLRAHIASALGFDSWAAYRLDAQMARTPQRALEMIEDVADRLRDKAREELATLAELKRADGDDTPFAGWDYPYYQAKLERIRFDVDSETISEYFPVDTVVTAVMAVYQHLFRVQFERIHSAPAWADGVELYAVMQGDAAEPVAWFYLDLKPRAGKFTRPAHFNLRHGRALPDGGYRQPVAAIVGNGPAGDPALFDHRNLVELFHEFGHLMHAVLSRAPYASLQGTNVRGDFVEAPSQVMENWARQPSVLRAVSAHVKTGEPLPEEIIGRLLASRHSGSGVFWTRQAFLGAYDLYLHAKPVPPDAHALWLELMPRYTPLPPVTGTWPSASFLPVMGGYDAVYYGYIWSRVHAEDMFTAFSGHHLTDGTTGMRFRREVLEPGGMHEPDVLLRNFLGRPPGVGAFYDSLSRASESSGQ